MAANVSVSGSRVALAAYLLIILMADAPLLPDQRTIDQLSSILV